METYRTTNQRAEFGSPTFHRLTKFGSGEIVITQLTFLGDGEIVRETYKLRLGQKVGVIECEMFANNVLRLASDPDKSKKVYYAVHKQRAHIETVTDLMRAGSAIMAGLRAVKFHQVDSIDLTIEQFYQRVSEAYTESLPRRKWTKADAAIYQA